MCSLSVVRCSAAVSYTHLIIAHAPYTLNACAADEGLREFARRTMEDDLMRMEYLPGNYYNFHPGSHVKQGPEEGVRKIAEILNQVLQPGQHTTVLLETMAGKGSEVGRRFEELRAILDRVEQSDHLGVCLDVYKRQALIRRPVLPCALFSPG